MWEYAARTAADATARIRFCTATGNPAAAADAASAASDALHVAAAALASRALCQAADSFDRAARQPYGRVPKPTSAGNQLRHPARLIAAYAHLAGDRTLTRSCCWCASPPWPRPSPNSASPSSAPPRLPPRSAPPGISAPPPGPPARPATRQARHGYRAVRAEIRPVPAAHCRRLARLSFPAAPRPQPPAPGQPGPGPGDPPPLRRPPPPRPRGPTR